MTNSDLDAEKIESNQGERTANFHRIGSLNLLIFTTLLVIVVLTIWIFKRRNFRYIHETCLALVYGKKQKQSFMKIIIYFFLRRFYHWSYSSLYKYSEYKQKYNNYKWYNSTEKCDTKLGFI